MSVRRVRRVSVRRVSRVCFSRVRRVRVRRVVWWVVEGLGLRHKDRLGL
jgi:hypothetical protein